jgi:transposase
LWIIVRSFASMKSHDTALSKALKADILKLARRRKELIRDMGFSEDITSTELAEKLHMATQTIDGLHRLINKQEQAVNLLSDRIAQKDKYIADLEAKITSFEAKKWGKPAKTSANSSIPPSRNPIGVPHTQSLRKKSDRPTGGQKGHAGRTRKQEAVESNNTEVWFPPETCPVCGKPIDRADARIGEMRQVIDIPFPIMYTATNHVSMHVKCSCGHCSKGLFPENVNAPVLFGPNIKAFVTYLSTCQNVPFKRLTHVLYTLFGLKMSEGSVSNILNDMRKCCKKPYEMIRRKIADSPVAGADETGINVNGKNNWMWTFQNRVATFLTIDKSRGHQVITKTIPEGGLNNKVLVTDRLPAYFMEDVGIADHQICLAHLLRNLAYTAQVFEDDPWSLDMMDLLRDSIHKRHEEMPSPDTKDEMLKRLDELLERPPVHKTDNGKPTELDKLKGGIRKHREYIFTFLSRPDVPPTNNDSEKAVRPAKTKLKISGCFRSKEGADNYATIGSVIQTAIKNGQDPFEVLRVVATVAAK